MRRWGLMRSAGLVSGRGLMGSRRLMGSRVGMVRSGCYIHGYMWRIGSGYFWNWSLNLILKEKRFTFCFGNLLSRIVIVVDLIDRVGSWVVVGCLGDDSFGFFDVSEYIFFEFQPCVELDDDGALINLFHSFTVLLVGTGVESAGFFEVLVELGDYLIELILEKLPFLLLWWLRVFEFRGGIESALEILQDMALFNKSDEGFHLLIKITENLLN